MQSEMAAFFCRDFSYHYRVIIFNLRIISPKHRVFIVKYQVFVAKYRVFEWGAYHKCFAPLTIGN